MDRIIGLVEGDWAVVCWDSNNDEAYFVNSPEAERPDTEYWVIRKKKYGIPFIKGIEFERFENCIKVFRCGSLDEARALVLIMHKFEKEQERKAGWNYLILICIIILVAFI